MFLNFHNHKFWKENHYLLGKLFPTIEDKRREINPNEAIPFCLAEDDWNAYNFFIFY